MPPLKFVRTVLSAGAGIVLVLSSGACSSAGDSPGRSNPASSDGGASGGMTHSTNGGSNSSTGDETTAILCTDDDCLSSGTGGGGGGVCGDGILTEDEACDDGNTTDDDGCSSDCLVLDPGYSCNPPGKPCHQVALCGDGLLAPNEMCDDGGTVDGDGCSARCKLELGYECTGEPSACSTTLCGDGETRGAESCDDGNTTPLDGCSSTCQAEPDCSGASCTSGCGDGLVIDEECDDGNTLDGDGCSSTCTREPGFDCQQAPACEAAAGGDCGLRVPVVFRDFTADHIDFRCGGSTNRPVIDTTLNAQGKPTLLDGSMGCISSPETFVEWYTDSPLNSAIPSSLLLFDDGNGGYVNRFGPAGERWVDLNGLELDGNPVFLPIDAAPGIFDDVRSVATIAPEYTGDNNWHPESDFVADAGQHNFLFTTEVGYWFRYDEGFAAQLDFLGDDDVWVFVNGVLALDLGGLHVPEPGVVNVDDTTAGTYLLEPGNVYAIKVFHAERNPTGSSFKLTLSGFESNPSECIPKCGDGIVSLGEECDDGVNDGGYGECEPGCKAGARCGDGIVQGNEDCDDGNRIDGDGCGSSCRKIMMLK